MPVRSAPTRWGIRLVATLVVVSGCQSDDGISPTSARPVASIELVAPTTSVLAGDTLRVTSVARDSKGQVIPDAVLQWSTPDASTARVLGDGRIVGVGHGTARIHASAAGGAAADAEVSIRLTTADRRFAYALAHDAESTEPYTPLRSFSHNSSGGEIRIARRGVGRYDVTFGRLAKVDPTFREAVVVTAYGSQGERCHIDGWGDAANGVDLSATVSCYDAADRLRDSRFTALVVGSQSLPGRHAFASLAPQPDAGLAAIPNSFSSSGEEVGVDRSGTGSYLVRMRAPRVDAPENYFASTVGGAPDLCKVSSWSQGDWASVVCYGPDGAHVDGQFSILMMEGGRPGKRFGFAWANDADAPIDHTYQPAAAYQRTSSGQSVTVTHTALGEYSVDFPGVANGGMSAEIVQVSPLGAGLTTCQLEGWIELNQTLRAYVRCWNRASGRREDSQFTVLVVE